MDNFWGMPIGSRVDPTLQGELPGPVYRDAGGNVFQTYRQEVPERQEPEGNRTWKGNALKALLPMGSWRNAIAGAYEGLTAPRRAWEGEPVTYGETFGTALDAAGGSATFTRPRNSLGIFAGRNAKTADLDMLNRAQDMASKGASRDDIWRDTGWFQGVDGEWRFEIDDSGAQFSAQNLPKTPNPLAMVDDYVRGKYPQYAQYKKPTTHPDVPQEVKREAYDWLDENPPSPTAVPLSQGFNHPDLYSAYGDDAGGMTLAYDQNMAALGAHEGGGKIRVGGGALGQGQDPGSVVLHEVMHSVQEREGFGLGSSPERAAFEMNQRNLKGIMEELPEVVRASSPRVQELWGERIRAQIADDWDKIDVIEDELASTSEGMRLLDMDWERQRLKAGNTVSPADAMGEYRRSAGEVEARNVQTRRNMTAAERRAKAPWETQDVPDAQQIVRRR